MESIMKINYNFSFGGSEFSKKNENSELNVNVGNLTCNGDVELSIDEMAAIFKNHRENISDLRNFSRWNFPHSSTE